MHINFSKHYLLLSAAMLILCPAVIFARGNYMKYVQWGEDAIGKGKYSEAIEYFKQAMEDEPSNPQNVMLLSNVGMLQHYIGEDSLALETLTHARAIAPASVVILQNRARVLESSGRINDALCDINIALDIDSTYAQGYYDRATLLLKTGDFPDALTDALKYEKLKPNDLSGILLLAVLYSNTGAPQEALPLYSKLIRESPEAEYYAARAMCNIAIDDLGAASDDIALGLELRPDDPELIFCRAVLNHLRFRDRDALVDLEHARQLGVAPDRINALRATIKP